MRSPWILAIALACALALASCGSDKKSPTEPVVDPAASQQETDAGNAALAAGDYAAANTHYKNAVGLDPSNTQAQLGAAITEVYLVQDDPQVADLIALLQGVPLPIPGAHGATPAARIERRLSGLALSDPSVRYDPVSGGQAAFKILSLAVNDPPALSDVQQLIKSVLMPRLQYAEDRLNAIEAHPDFVLLLLPELTGEPDTIEVDVGDVLMLDATINGVQGWLNLLVAYNFDVASYDSVNAESLLAAGTDFGTLHSDGVSQLAASRANLMTAKLRIDAAVASIQGETDDQGDDVIPAAALATPGFLEFQQGVDDVYDALSAAVVVVVQTYQGADFNLTIDLGKFFTNPIADLKTKLPDHAFDAHGDPYATDPLTFPDPTIGAIFPNMTNALWQDVVGPLNPPVAAR